MARPRMVVSVVVALLLLSAWGSAEAQMRPASAEIVRATGRVDVLPKGQTAWVAGTVGARLVEGDQVRALAGGAADLTLPDGSTILIAENTRFAVAKLEYDTGTRDRNASFHVVAGKVRAQVSQAAVQLVRARQSNFNISTPNGVAAVRGTIVIIAYNPATRENLTFVFPSPGQAPSAARVTYVTRGGQAVTITGNNFVRQVGNQPPSAPAPISSLPGAVQAALQTAQNPSTAGAGDLITIQVTIPSSQDTQNIVDTGGAGALDPAIIPTNTSPGGAPPPSGEPLDPNRNNPPAPTTPPPTTPLVCPDGQFGKPPNCTRCATPPCEG